MIAMHEFGLVFEDCAGYGISIIPEKNFSHVIHGIRINKSSHINDYGSSLDMNLQLESNKNSPKEVLIFRVPIASLHAWIGTDRLTMMVNSQNIKNGTAGLVYLAPLGGKSRESEPEPVSHWWTLLGDPIESSYIFFGFKTPIRHLTFLRFKDGYFECGCEMKQRFGDNDSFSTDTLLIWEGKNPHKLLESFGDYCAGITPGRLTLQRQIAWNSWDYYYTCFSEKDLIEILRELPNLEDAEWLRIGPVVIDMGWYTEPGEWSANGRFPGGMKKAADLIKKKGFIPGIWLCPFNISDVSRTFLRTPQVCVKSPEGKVCAPGGGTYLDPTNPEGGRLLSSWFRKLYNEGYKYYKLDFLHYMATTGNHEFEIKEMGRIEVLRYGLKIIRDSVGNDSYILACGCPPEAALGIVDSYRIGGDIATYFSTTKLQAQFLSCRYWMNNRFWVNDPDFLMARGKATANDAHHNTYHQPELIDEWGTRSGPPWSDINEPGIWATLIGMSGGAITLADNLGKLNHPGKHLLKTAIENADCETARPLDIMEKLHPQLWYREGKKPALAVINWDDEPGIIKLPIQRYPEIEKFVNSQDVWQNIGFEKKPPDCFLSIPARDAAWFIK